MEQKNILLSIIVPMYNAEKTISDCIDSILNQDFEEYELILVDDGSTDNTLQICKVYAEKDTRIIIVPLKKNMGLIAARKSGVESARANVIGFVDSDDWIEKDMYSRLMKIQKEYDCELVSSGIFRDFVEEHYTVEVVDNFSEGMYYNLPECIYHTMLFDDKNRTFGIFCTLVNKLFKKDILTSVYDDIDTRVSYGEDCLTLFSYIMRISNLYILRESFYHYNIRRGSMCRSADIGLSVNTYYLYKGLEKAFIGQKDYKYVLLRQLKKYILGVELHTLEKLYNISTFSLGTYKYCYEGLENKKVILYGAGNSSESLYKYLTEECNCNIVAWIDKYPKGKDMRVLHDILPLNSIMDLKYDYIVIATVKQELAMGMKKELMDSYKVDEKKIKWNKVEYCSLIDKL